MMDSSVDGILAAEARFLHRCFFKGEIPPEVVQRYISANRLCVPQSDSRASSALREIIAHRLDAEAIELVFRLHRIDSVLTRKINIVFYLVEVRSTYYEEFVSDEAAFLRALGGIVLASVKTAYKYCKGRILVWRYRLV